ncbi:hypothetical protein [Elioraea thermophila]|uniref:hypothetical protein n=1 Tax=Elioraea thermophila TaxID=2185104 RepID=UPI000DF362DA|nr:hypothetical protein [Elioraea thermophila]
MAQLVPIASIVTGVAGLVGAQQQYQAQRRALAAQAQAAEAREAQLRAATEESQRRRREMLARTIASTRARLAASGVGASEGSSAALLAGLEKEANEQDAFEEQQLALRLSAGRRSLLEPTGNLTPFIRAGTQLATGLSQSIRSLLNL